MAPKFGSRKGSVFTMLMATVAMVGIVSAGAMNLIGGPITTAAKVTHQNMAQNDLLMNAKVVVMNASTRLNMGDEDSDGYIEPVPFIPTSHSSCGIALPGEGGCLPGDIGAILTDPWGTQYAYCVWDHGDMTGSANRIVGEDSTSGAVLAIISAGPNTRFETPCSAYDGDPDTNDIAINPDGIGDDLVQIYTYAGAVAGSGGLWELKENEPETAVIDKRLEVGDVAGGTGFAFDTTTGEGEFPYIKTDFLASKTGGNTPVTMVNNIALDGNWLSGDGGNRGVFVDANGNIGINTATPERVIHVVGTGGENDDLLVESNNDIDSNGGIIAFLRSRGTNSAKTAVLNTDALASFSGRGWSPSTGTYDVGGEIHVQASSDWNVERSARMRFRTRNEGVLADRVVISSNGNVGIGTFSPSSRLHVVDAGDNGLRFETIKDVPPAPANSHDISRLTIDAAGASYPELYLRTVNSSSTTTSVLSGGNINIGTTGPVLDISFGYSNGYISGNPSQPNHVSRVFIDNSTGHVGIGTSTPEKQIHIKGDGFIILENPVGDKAQINIGDSNGLLSLTTDYDGVNQGIHITKTGNVGVGTLSPTQKLQVNGLIDATNNRILRVATPSASTDAANKSYVDSLGGRTCANGQILKFQSGAWACAADNSGGGADNLGSHVATTTLVPNADNTHDLGSVALRWKNGRFAGTVTAVAFSGSGASLTALNATQLTTGTVPVARIGTGTKNTTTFYRGDGTFAVPPSGLTQSDADTRYVNTAGDTMTGNLWFTGAARRIGTSDANTFVIRTNAVDRISIDAAGNISLSNQATATGHAVRADRTLTAGTGITGGGNLTANRSFAFDTTWGDGRYVNTSGDTMTGDLMFSGAVRYTGTSTNHNFVIRTNNTNRITIAAAGATTFAGNVTAPAFLYSSDARLKDDISPLEPTLDALGQIGTYRYHYKSDLEKTPHIGVLAQEVKAVFPEAVKTDEDSMMSVDYPALVPVLLEAVKQLKAENDAIRRQMKADNDNLRMEIHALTKEAR